MKKFLKFGGFAIVMAAVLFAPQIFGMSRTDGLQMAVTPVVLPVLNQLAEKEMLKNFSKDGDWMSELKSKQQWLK